MEINSSAAIKTAIICIAVAGFYWNNTSSALKNGEINRGFQESLKTDFEKCLSSAKLTDLDGENKCRNLYGSTHAQQKMELMKNSRLP